MRILILILTVLCLSGFDSDNYYAKKVQGGCFKYDGNLVCVPDVVVEPQIDRLQAIEDRISALEVNDEGVTITTYITED